MQQLILTSVLIATFVIPAVLLRRSDRGDYRLVLGPFSLFVVVYVVLLLFVYPRLF